MAKQEVKLTPDDALDILASVVEELRAAGLRVGFRDAPANDKRAAGLLIFVEGVGLDGETFVMKK